MTREQVTLRPVSSRPKRLLVFLLCVVVAWYAHRPLLGAGFLGSDVALLEDIDQCFDDGGWDAAWSVEAVEHRPVAAVSLALSRSFHAKGGVYTPGDAGRLRLESLLILVIAAFGVRASVIRGLRPWTGEDHARSAGAAAGSFLMVHPLLVPVVAHLPARGDVVGLAASAWSVALLLEGRQQRRAVALASAFVLAVVAAASSPAALVLVPLGFGLEFIAARRHRPFRARLKTAIQVALGYAAALGVEALVRMGARPSGAEAGFDPAQGFDPGALLAPEPTGFAHAFAVAAEKTGVVVLPVNTSGIGTLGYVLAVVALLAALHPGFVAARAAPRLWGRVLGGWAIAILVLLLLGIRQRAVPESLSDAPGTLSLAVTMAVGLGISATALSGARRSLLPGLTGGLYAVLTAGSAATIQWAAAEVGVVHEAVLAAGKEDGWSRVTWVLDPPRRIAGVEALAPEHDRSLTSAPFLPPGTPPLEVRGVPSGAFWLLTDEPEFQAARRRGLTLLLPPVRVDDVPEDQRPVESPRGRHDALRSALLVRDVMRLEPPVPGQGLGDAGVLGWIGEGTSPMDRPIDPLDVAAAEAVVPVGVDPSELSVAPPVFRWTGADGAEVDGELAGVWMRGKEGPWAAFRLGADPRWILGGTVRSVWFAGVLHQAESARVSRAPRPLGSAVAPRVVGADWTFDIAGLELDRPLDAGAREVWRLWAVDPVTGRFAQLFPTGAASGRLVAEGAAALHGREIVWCLDREVEGIVVERARGRRLP